jgi:hypothetical protein
MAAFARLDLGLLGGIHLEKAVKVLSLAPPSTEVIHLDFSGGQINDDGVDPIRQLHRQPFDFAAEELGLALHWRWQIQAMTGSADGDGVLYMRLN